MQVYILIIALITSQINRNMPVDIVPIIIDNIGNMGGTFLIIQVISAMTAIANPNIGTRLKNILNTHSNHTPTSDESCGFLVYAV